MASSSSSGSRRRNFSTMEESSTSLPLSSPFMTGPNSPPPHSPPPLPESQSCHPNPPPRDPYRESDFPFLTQSTCYQGIVHKRLTAEASRNNTIIRGSDLRSTVAQILESNGVEPLRELIVEFVNLPDRRKNSKRKIFISFSYSYPSIFSLKLAELLLLHPPLHIRKEVVLLLNNVLTETRNGRIASTFLDQLKTPIFESFKVEVEEVIIDQLSEAIGNLDSKINASPIGGWIELHEYIVSCVSLDSNDHDSVLKQRKGLMLLADLSSDIVQMKEFWRSHYSAVYDKLKARLLNEVANEKNFHAITFDALHAMMGMAQNLREIEIGRSILSMLIDYIGQHSNDAVVLKRVKGLGDFVFTGVGQLINGKEKKVFQSMLGIAEKKTANMELRCAAIQVLQNIRQEYEDIMLSIIKELSYYDAQRALKVSMDMLLCVEDDPFWFEIDDKDSISAGLSESFRHGKFLLNWLFCQGDGSIVVPITFELLNTTDAASNDWRKHHAEMIVIAALAVGQKDEVAKRFEEIEKLVFGSLNGHHRVIWAAVNAMRIMGEHNLIPTLQYHKNFFAKLLPIAKYSSFPSVQVEAMLAIRPLFPNLFDKYTSLLDETYKLMLELLTNDKQKIQEEAVETLKLVVVSIPTSFRKYYDTMVEGLKAILFSGFREPNIILRAKTLELMCIILMRNEFVNFKREDAVKVMKSFKILIVKLSNKDYLLKCRMLKALSQFCRFPGTNIDQYINKLMPMLLQSAQLDIDLKCNTDTSESIFFENERVEALNVLSQCAVRRSHLFYRHLYTVSQIFVNLLSCSRHETRMASVSALPNILHSVKSGEKDEMVRRNWQNSIVQSLLEALHKETSDTVKRNMLNILSKCIEISGSVFTPELIRMIVDEIVHIINLWSHKITESKRETEISEGGSSEYLPDKEIVKNAKFLIISMAETFEGQLLPYVDNLFSTVAQIWSNDLPDRMKEIAVSIFNTMVPYFPDKLPMYHDIYTYELLKAGEGSTNSQREIALGIGICAQFGGENFKTVVHVAMSKLLSIRLIEIDETGDGASISDMAVSSLWKIWEFHRDTINGPEVIQRLLQFLPLTNDVNEARYVHAQLCKMLRRNGAEILGRNSENLAQIIYIFSIILFRRERLITEQTYAEIIHFLDNTFLYRNIS